MGGFWSGERNKVVEPKRAFRWLINFPGDASTGIESWVATEVNKPGFAIGETEHGFLNYKFNYPGHIKWDDVSLTIVDPVDTDQTVQLVAMLEKAGYRVPPSLIDSRGQINVQTISKKEATNAVGSITIAQYGSGDTKVEEWELHNAWIKECKFGKLSYDSEDLVKIELVLKYDWATLRTAGDHSLANMTSPLN
jgi:hypothetical protein